MVIIFLRAAIIFITLIVIMRLMGKRQIGEMQPYEFIITMLIAEVACVPMSDVSIPLLYGISSIFAIFILHQFLSYIELGGQFLKRVVNGKPSIIIDTNGVNITELGKNNLDVEDLLGSLRSTGCFSLAQVKYAILEANGKLSVVKNEEFVPASLPILVIQKGKILSRNLKMIGYSDKMLAEKLYDLGIKNQKKVDIFTVDGEGNCYIQERKKKYSVNKISIKKELKW